MQKNIKKALVIIPMVFLLCMSFIGTMAMADDKVNQTNTVDSSNKNQGSSSANTTSSNPQVNNNTATVSGKNDQGKSTSTVNENDNQNQNSETSTVEVLPAWQNLHGKWYYVTKDGILTKTGWFKEKDVNPNANNDNEFYLGSDYAATIGWKKIEGSWYYFNEAGIKQTGWQYGNYGWFYLDKNGIMQTGWLNDKGYKYYLSADGIMLSGKQYIDGKWYFFASNGSLKTGFYSNNGKTYYSNSDGEMGVNQWITTKTSKYYVKADSSIATGYAIINNEAENFDVNGRYIGPTQMKDYLFVRHLNVGDADCAFVKLPDGETALIDTGLEETSDKLVSFLKSQDLKQEDGEGVIDYVIISHAHSDHIGGLSAVLSNFKVGKVYMPDIAKMKNWYSGIKDTAENASDIELMKHDYEVYNRAVAAMNAKEMEFINPKHDEFIDKGKILQFVQSGKDFGGIGSDKLTQYYWGINENSDIVYLNYGDLQELFTGDMEWNSELDFWTNNMLDGRKVDVLKVPHHGNDTSSTQDFINHLKPVVGIISRSKESVKQNTAYNNLISGGVSLYETSSNDDGVSIYATKDNWTIQN